MQILLSEWAPQYSKQLPGVFLWMMLSDPPLSSKEIYPCQSQAANLQSSTDENRAKAA